MSDPTKKQTLRNNGTLNLQPQRVADPLFTENGFFDPDDLLQVKYEMLRHVQSDGWSVTQAAAHFGFSRVAYYQLDKAFSTQGLPGLFPRKRGPKGAHKLTQSVLDFVQKIQVDTPNVHIDELVQHVQTQFDISVHARTLTRVLALAKKKRLPREP